MAITGQHTKSLKFRLFDAFRLSEMLVCAGQMINTRSLYTRGADEVFKGFDVVGLVLVLVLQSSQTGPETTETLTYDATAGNA